MLTLSYCWQVLYCTIKTWAIIWQPKHPLTKCYHIKTFVQRRPWTTAIYIGKGEVYRRLLKFSYLGSKTLNLDSLELPHRGVLMSTHNPFVGQKLRNFSLVINQQMAFLEPGNSAYYTQWPIFRNTTAFLWIFISQELRQHETHWLYTVMERWHLSEPNSLKIQRASDCATNKRDSWAAAWKILYSDISVPYWLESVPEL